MKPINMNIIIGLGNPGKQYEQTRHNAGFMFLDVLQKRYEFPPFSFDKKFNAQTSQGFKASQEKIILAKPQTFMNHSGQAVKALIDFYKIEPKNIIVVADDLDLELGNYKISQGTSSAGHNGVQNIIDILGTKDFKRIRIGIEKEGGRNQRGQIPGEKFVLQRFEDKELLKLSEIFNLIEI
jgi:PTH1 family peptidyl-tRNA hydrolase